MINVQKIKPTRTCAKSYSDYRSFRGYLKGDFNNRCGYCDDPDLHCGQEISYHIDHFKPKSKFPKLETNYDNLVYSCPYCNRAKSDKWKEKNGFIDPCSREYDENLQRNDKGEIQSTTERGKYIVQNLQLYLRRHKLIWALAILGKKKLQLDESLDAMPTNDPNELKILRKFKEIQEKIDAYTAGGLGE
ncbi:HNH endonuclease [bacterium endosymbiont of Bathymodiolus sp. 5 South]|jgi:uncharacterized protein (TIGR02646 family)|uniref:HNH endonuclease n=1 Tax=bacterium endosymbiont of Bathymodiolus sp. 5 South TaxID=1181670 RepID=UPI0010B70D4B|nr:HNH endonuclease [bacterium endosymbiont of Bathymodiolus sp. 5 South]SHN92932.1 hypothetical protein BCLUESOX_204 [bacterium endosymbiont of Bathymodiolus sp. 5 South]VVM22161.1 hypothetical protein BSPWISOXPB_1229 [uncultured Gammaproteobacteria bacterium]